MLGFRCLGGFKMLDDISKKQIYLWDDFINQITYVNRFISHHEILDRLKTISETNVITLSEETVLYRARIYDGDVGFIREFEEFLHKQINQKKYAEASQQDNNTLENLRRLIMDAERRKKRGLEERMNSRFWGFDEQESFIPQNADVVKEGRANPDRIKYLYVADQPNTALAEVRPLLKNYVSIAEIKVVNKLKIADLTYDIFKNINENDMMLVYLIMEEYAKPNNNEPFHYLPTQYISEYIKSIGFDGIKYNSSLYRRGRNYVIFNYDKCKAVSSKLYELDDICYDAKCVGPVGILFGDEDLYHWKLELYKEEQKKKLMEELPRLTLPETGEI